MFLLRHRGSQGTIPLEFSLKRALLILRDLQKGV